ncbi:MAG: long-chain fatty acid--CoA ligase [Alphaproteobacteria bacterium]|nr:long-chain fatty acid--CoA ligase [Alphaproteobacteria bacterium]
MNYRTCPNLVRLFLDQAARLGDKPLLWAKRNNAWQSWSWKQAEAEVRRVAGGLAAQGIKPGDRVALVAENRPEWVIADLAIMAAGAIAVPAYTTNTVEDHRHILSNAGCAGAIVSTRELADRVITAARQTPGCGFVVAIEPPPLTQDVGLRVLRWDALSGDHDPAASAARITRRDLACIIHTSGTGGQPKGVALPHGSLLHNCQGAHDVLAELGLSDEVFLSFLPMSHSYEHMAGVHFPISIGAQIYCAESVEALPANMLEARPTIMTAVPRLYETMHRRILSGVERQGGLKAKLFFKALELGTKRYHEPESLTPGERLVDLVVDKLVRDKVRGRFGGRLKALVSGGAALNPEIGVFFTALGLRLLQGYGQTEAAPVIACNRPRRVRLETVGPPLTDVEVKTAEDGELLVRGELVMQGYWNDPAATAATVKDGWLHTGDIGVIEPDGYIRITDRKKDFIKNSGGDMIAPARVEGALVLESEIAQAMVYGDRRPHLVAVLVPHADFLESWAKSQGKPAVLADLAEEPGLRSALDAVVQRVNAKLPLAERVRRFIVAREPFSVANELMTPTLKVKRHKVREVYGSRLDALYDRG